MQKKDLLVVFNIFGISSNENEQIVNYISTLESIFWHIDTNNLHDSVRVVVSSVLSSDKCINTIKKHFNDKVSIFRYDERWSVQVSSNKTILSSVSDFQEQYEGYLYVSSGLMLPEIEDLFPRAISKNNSGEYGIIHLQTDSDQGYEWLGKLHDWKNINFEEDYDIPIGNHCNFHIAVINKELLEFYGKPITDVHGLCCMEAGLPYTSYALRKKYILLGNSECVHFVSFDKDAKMVNISGPIIGRNPHIPCGLLWGRTKESFLNDLEGIESGLGYYAGSLVNNPVDWNGTILMHRRDKYDEKYLSLDEKLRYAVKRAYFTNEREINYNNISYTLIK